ncbi:MAG: branched-chain amino acid ABC transporter substrate-binding protein [Rhodospirillales bacterium 69-11]|nr:ABC transporter substrate-binding protein [Rhodospirillales bacterium]MBN8926588.1 ABC transporter substrate-binding protein [Rhodospirillales bacterium]OJW25985.1 MAG: branched-chain amino acid ABC transporter substrate-binding protein [Rhodospirillales bacterium 69-11]
MHRRAVLTALAASAAAPFAGRRAFAADTPGVTATELKIGNTAAYSGPASAYGVIARTEAAVFKMINEQGGVGGRKIRYISYDDGYSPPKTVDQVRRLVEQDEVAFIFATIGTPTNTAIARYTNSKGVPLIFLGSGANKWGDPKNAHWVMGWQPSYRTEAQIYTRYILKTKPDAKIAILYQNDDFGKDYPAGVRDALGKDFDKYVVKEVTYEVTDATIDSQVLALKASGANVLITAATPKFAAQTIRKVADTGWKPLHFMTNVSISVGSVINPAGPDNAVGLISAAYLKDPTSPAWKDDPGMNEWRAFMAKYMPDTDLTDAGPVFGYGVTMCLWQVLKQCGTDFSRANIMKQAANLKDLSLPVLLPGITVNTSPTNYHPIRQMQLQRFDGKTFELFGPVLEGATA